MTVLDDLRRVERHHRDLVLRMRRCFHTKRQDGCPRCWSNHVLDTCAWLITDLEKFEQQV
jgi:hypothetical protein